MLIYYWITLIVLVICDIILLDHICNYKNVYDRAELIFCLIILNALVIAFANASITLLFGA